MAEFPGGPVVRTPCFDYWDPGSIPGQGTKILQALSKEKKQTKPNGVSIRCVNEIIAMS